MGYQCDMNCFECRFPDCVASPADILRNERKEAGIAEGKKLVRNHIKRGEIEQGKRIEGHYDNNN